MIPDDLDTQVWNPEEKDVALERARAEVADAEKARHAERERQRPFSSFKRQRRRVKKQSASLSPCLKKWRKSQPLECMY